MNYVVLLAIVASVAFATPPTRSLSGVPAKRYTFLLGTHTHRGHLMPTLWLATALATRHNVAVATAHSFISDPLFSKGSEYAHTALVDATHLDKVCFSNMSSKRFKPFRLFLYRANDSTFLPRVVEMAETDDVIGLMKLSMSLSLDRFEEQLAIHREYIARENPDVCIYDVTSIATLVACRTAGIPTIAMFPSSIWSTTLDNVPLFMSPQTMSHRSMLTRLVQKLSLLAIHLDLPGWLGGVHEALAVANVEDYNQFGFASMMDRSLVLVTSFYGFDFPTALPANHVLVGSMQPDEYPTPKDAWKALPDEMKEWLDNSPADYPNGVVFASFGTSGFLLPHRVLEFVEMVRRIGRTRGLRVLWKLDPLQEEVIGKGAGHRPDNLRIVSWITPSLSSILVHPKVRAFITHCGLTAPFQGMFAGVPMIGAGAIGDQMYRVHHLEHAGIGRAAPFPLMADSLALAVEQVVDNEVEHRKAIARLVDIYAHSGLGVKHAANIVERAATVGIDHLLTPNRNVPAYERLGLDLLVGALFVGVFLALMVPVGCRVCARLICGRGGGKIKKE